MWKFEQLVKAMLIPWAFPLLSNVKDAPKIQ